MLTVTDRTIETFMGADFAFGGCKTVKDLREAVAKMAHALSRWGDDLELSEMSTTQSPPTLCVTLAEGIVQ
jgi:hypothetical protein